MIVQGVILASGLGSRLNKDGSSMPKPLMKVGGITLIQRIIRLMRNAGVEKIVVVVGFKKEVMKSFLSQHEPDITIVENDEFRKSNGISLLVSRQALDPAKPFLLSMSDHIFSSDYVQKFISRSADQLQKVDAVLGIDREIDDVFDLDDATKVFTEEDRIIKIDKALKAYNAIDTGIFLCSPLVFDHLEAVYKEKGDVSISDGMRHLADNRRFGYADMSSNLWQDVDTPGMKFEAEKRILSYVLKRRNSNRVWEHTLDRICSRLILFSLKRENPLIDYIHIIYAFFLILFLAIGLRAAMPCTSILLLAASLLFFNTRKLVEQMRPKAKVETMPPDDIFVFPTLVTVSMLPVIFDAAPLISVLSVIISSISILYPLIKNIHPISLPALTRNKINIFFSYSLFALALPLFMLIRLNSSIISIIFIIVLFINNTAYCNHHDQH